MDQDQRNKRKGSSPAQSFRSSKRTAVEDSDSAMNTDDTKMNLGQDLLSQNFSVQDQDDQNDLSAGSEMLEDQLSHQLDVSESPLELAHIYGNTPSEDIEKLVETSSEVSDFDLPVVGNGHRRNGPYSSGFDRTVSGSSKSETKLNITLGDSVEWQKTIERVVKSVVSIQFAQVANFDCDNAVVSEATGFVVDAERGLIMTNRHVVGAGPFTGFAVFDNHEECDVYPLCKVSDFLHSAQLTILDRDPVHDFGLLRFDPKAVKYMKISALQLRPDLASVGAEIRVIGNDAGEKLSILSGFISRLDRNAPDYGDLTYNDFNTEYIQAAASASGGSSGSPVVNIDGYAVAIQAGGSSESSTDYFLPLYRGLRALECVQRKELITRGTIQVQWYLRPFDECRRLGLRSDTESLIRDKFPDGIGMLVAETILPEGPSHKLIEEGDCLVSVNSEMLTKFVRLDEILDSSVGKTITIVIQRGGQDKEISITVGDLHAITPDRYVEVAGATFHNLSYQVARLYAIPVRGVYLANPAGSFRLNRDRGWLVQSIDNRPTGNLDEFIEVMKSIRDRQWVVLTCINVQDMHSTSTTISFIDRHWTEEFRLVVRNDQTGLWDFQHICDPLPPLALQPRSATFTEIKNSNIANAAKLIRSFVRVTCLLPILIDGFPRSAKYGQGLVVDAERGLVLVARSIVPYDLCDIIITVADSILVPGKVVFLHPLQGWTIVSYDPAYVDAPVESAVLSQETIQRNCSTIFMGFSSKSRVLVARTSVTDISTLTVAPNVQTPRYRAIMVDAITVDTVLGNQCGSGILVNTDGVVEAVWLTLLGDHNLNTGRDSEHCVGISTASMYDIIFKLRRGETPSLRLLDVELNSIQMSQARIRGVSENWISKVEQANTEHHQLFAVRKIVCGDVNQTLEEGDVILSVNGKTLTRISELDMMYDNKTLNMDIIRRGEEQKVIVPTVSTEHLETDRIVIWCGAIIHEPHHAVRQQIRELHSGVYISARVRGSPAYQYSLVPTYFITHVNGQATPDISTFLGIVSLIPDNTYARLRIVSFESIPFANSVKSNLHYFPTLEMVKDKCQAGVWKTYVYKDGVRSGDNPSVLSETTHN
ncbi:trypsin-like cysteine/serine peptidase domain-containing protein [Lipomyces oligophaga]|uniref:trypsin-like cysteine/serine peptidase domain-containing protein n=1 Tax=Lipomyces oligophaga TaxID=45792 RepID=UPI0034CE2648